ncbi:flagellar hook-length control protein FliK [Vibrio harveyi]|nr:flagellar hook-length control protein FliK [Vibrio harveyi]
MSTLAPAPASESPPVISNTGVGENIAFEDTLPQTQTPPSMGSSRTSSSQIEKEMDSEELEAILQDVLPFMPQPLIAQMSQSIQAWQEGTLSSAELTQHWTQTLARAHVDLSYSAQQTLTKGLEQWRFNGGNRTDFEAVLRPITQSLIPEPHRMIPSFAQEREGGIQDASKVIETMREALSSVGTRERIATEFDAIQTQKEPRLALLTPTLPSAVDPILKEEMMSKAASSMVPIATPSSPSLTPSSSTPSSNSVSVAQWHAQVNINEPHWGRELVDQLRSRLQLSQTKTTQQAHVRLDPPELGKLEISLRVEGDKVSVHIAAAHPQLREALVAHSDRLRLDIAQSQLQLADVSVSSGLQQQHKAPVFEPPPNTIRRGRPHFDMEQSTSHSMSSGWGRFESMV